MTSDIESKESEKRKGPEIPRAEKIEKLGLAVAALFATALDLLVSPSAHSKKRVNLNGTVIVAAVLSVCGSTTLMGLVIGQHRILTTFCACVITLLSWVLFGVIGFLLCRVLRGVGTLKATIALTTQILSVVTLIMAFCAYLLCLLPEEYSMVYGFLLAWVIGLVLLVLYFGYCIGSLYGFGAARSSIVGFVLGISSWLLYLIVWLATAAGSARPIAPMR